MVWTDLKKANDMVEQIWIDCLKMYKISDNDIKFIAEAIKSWNLEIKAEGKNFDELKI